MIWNFSHLFAFQMDFPMKVSSLQQERKMTTCACTNDPQPFTWQVTIMIMTWNVSQAAFQAAVIFHSLVEGKHSPFLWNFLHVMMHVTCQPLVATSSIFFTCHLSSFPFSFYAHCACCLCALSLTAPLLMVMFPHCFSCLSVPHSPPEISCQKSKVSPDWCG